VAGGIAFALDKDPPLGSWIRGFRAANPIATTALAIHHLPPNGDRTIASTIYNSSFWPKVTAQAGAAKYEIVKIPSGAWLGYAISRRWGGWIEIVANPPLAHVIKPEFPELRMDEGSKNSRSNEMKRLTKRLLANLPRLSVHFTLPDDIDPGILAAFEEAGFSFQREATFIFHPPTIPPDATPADRRRIVEGHINAMWSDAKQEMRRKINKARRENKIWIVGDDRNSDSITPQQFEEFYLNSLQEKGKKNAKNLALIRFVMEESIKLGQGRIIAAMSERGIEYAVAIIWEADRSYFWAAQSRNDLYKGASELVIFEAMKLAARLGLILDFDGQADQVTVYNNALGKPGTPTAAVKVLRINATRLTILGRINYGVSACRKWVLNKIAAPKPHGAIP
jgi:hypothetical protein